MPIKFPLKSGQEVIQNIIDETPHEDILKDLENLKRKINSYSPTLITKCISPNMTEIPSIMREIGRQRELTFRAIGEGPICLLI